MKLFKNRTVLGVICIVLSLLICFGIAPLLNKQMSQKTEIVRVKEAIKIGEIMTENKLEMVEVGAYNLPEGVMKSQDAVIGTYALADFSAGDYILNAKISETMQEENAYLYNLNGEKQALSITLKSFANGLSGKLESGDIVSVIAPDYREQGHTVIPPELKYVEVISVTADTGYDANQRDAQSNAPSAEEERELPVTVTLLVTPEQGNLLAELEAEGIMHLSLVYRGDVEKAEEFIGMQEEIMVKIPSQAEEKSEVE